MASSLIEASSRPHICLSLHSDLEPSKLRTVVENFALQQQPIPISLSALGTYLAGDSSVFFLPSASLPLILLHDHFHELLKRLELKCESLFLPGRWLPLCPVAEDLSNERLPQVVAHLKETTRLPLSGHLCYVGLVALAPSVYQHYSFPLGGDYL
eukprot:TRINITY_DN1835_c0_g1_i2.p1 TRINITY_DN1835_c0_g1~~TRINITY_DN1835_c0_g1_i2.p1  ORF type:complete len:155 (+),score=26.03 TRINITY_DN1835_c0_g1_i2:146-610(+)